MTAAQPKPRPSVEECIKESKHGFDTAVNLYSMLTNEKPKAIAKEFQEFQPYVDNHG